MFVRDTAACEHFEKIKEFKIDENSHPGRELEQAKETGKYHLDAIKAASYHEEDHENDTGIPTGDADRSAYVWTTRDSKRSSFWLITNSSLNRTMTWLV